MEKTLVSVIVPVFNSEKFLEECLYSVLQQTYKNVEIICVDDGSTDNSWKIINDIKQKNNNVFCYKTNHLGQSNARNLGLSKSRGEYVLFIDSDDVIEKRTIENNLFLMENGKLDVSIYNMKCFFPNFVSYVCFDNSYYNNKSLEFCNPKLKDNAIQFTNAAIGMFRKNFLEKNKIKFQKGMIYEDWEFMSQVMCAAEKICISSYPYYFYRRGFALTTTSNTSEKCFDLFKAYYLARSNIIKNKCQIYNYHNDAKILKEASSFYYFNLQNKKTSAIGNEFLSQLKVIISSFNDIYFKSLLNKLQPHERKIVLYLRKNQIWKIKNLKKIEKFRQCRDRIKRPVKIVLAYLQDLIRFIKYSVLLLICQIFQNRKNL